MINEQWIRYSTLFTIHLIAYNNKIQHNELKSTLNYHNNDAIHSHRPNHLTHVKANTTLCMNNLWKSSYTTRHFSKVCLCAFKFIRVRYLRGIKHNLKKPNNMLNDVNMLRYILLRSKCLQPLLIHISTI